MIGLDDPELTAAHLRLDDKSSGENGEPISVSFKPESVLDKAAKIANFSIDQKAVRFAWDKDVRGGTERNAAAALRDCVLEVRESGNLRWTLVLRSPHHKPPFELHRNRDDDIDWEGDPPPVRPLFLRKCSLTPKPGATHTLRYTAGRPDSHERRQGL